MKFFNKVITRQKIEGTLAGLLISIASWWLVVEIREQILKYSPIKNTILIAVILFAIAWWLEVK